MACNIIGFQDGFSWSDVKIFTVLALKDGSTMALQSVTMYFGFEFGRAEKYSLLPQNIILVKSLYKVFLVLGTSIIVWL